MSEDTDHVVDASSSLTDDEAIRYTQRLRRQLIDEMAKGGLPNDPKDRTLFLRALSDMDQTALTNKRIGVEEGNNENNRAVVDLVSKLSRQFGGRSPFEVIDGEAGEIKEADEAALPPAETVPGEMRIGLEEMNYDDFVKDHENQK